MYTDTVPVPLKATDNFRKSSVGPADYHIKMLLKDIDTNPRGAATSRRRSLMVQVRYVMNESGHKTLKFSL